MSKGSARSVLRQLLRATDKHVTSVAGNLMWRDHILAQFRANAHVQDPAQQQQLLLTAKECADLVLNVAHHQELLQRYNIGVDPDERNKQMVSKTAARVGFRLPTAGEQPQQAAAAAAAANSKQRQQPQQQQEDFRPEGQQQWQEQAAPSEQRQQQSQQRQDTTQSPVI